MMDRTLAELVRISNEVGADKWLVLGGFGNTSVKTRDGKYMYIKASGTGLKDMTSTKGWRRLRVEAVLAILKDRTIASTDGNKRQSQVSSALLSAADDEFDRGVKPSIESCFHAMFGRYVIHLHPVAVLGYACARDGKKAIDRLFKNRNLSPVWVPYANPGYMLAKRIEKVAAGYERQYGRLPAVLFLQNHGVVVTADNANTTLQLVHRVIKLCESKLNQPKPVRTKPADERTISELTSCIGDVIFEATGKRMQVEYFTDDVTAWFMARKDAGQLCAGEVVTPDELVYARGRPVWIDKWRRKTLVSKLNRRIAAGRKPPAGFLVKPYGLFVAGPKNALPLLKDVISNCLAIRAFAARFGGIRPLNKRQRQFIIGLIEKNSTAETGGSGCV